MAQDARQRWRKVVQRQNESGLSVAEFCRRKQIAPASFYQWRKRFQLDADAPSADPLFTPVQVLGAAGPNLAPVEIEFPCGVLLRLPSGDTESLKQAIAALTAAHSHGADRTANVGGRQ
jgi:transposase-like protein